LRFPDSRSKGVAGPTLEDNGLRVARSNSSAVQNVTRQQVPSWLGNIRELEKAMRTIVILNDPEIILSRISIIAPNVSVVVAAQSAALKAATRTVSHRTQQRLIFDALPRKLWNHKRAVQELQIPYKSLRCKRQQIGAKDPDKI
jgi:DNA-binding NtrC family response regulator